MKRVFIGIFILIIIILFFHSFREGYATSTESKIPKIIIQTWKTKEIPHKYLAHVESIKTKNPDFQYMFFSDKDIETFFHDKYPEYYSTFQKLPTIIQKIDFFRYVAIYHYGGIYLDLDMMAIEPIDNVLLQHSCVFPIDEFITSAMCNNERYRDFCDENILFLLGQYAFAAEPKNEFIKALVDSIDTNIQTTIKKYKRNSHNYIYQTTGPDFVTKTYMSYFDKSNITILNVGKRQYFGKYARHDFFGSWK